MVSEKQSFRMPGGYVIIADERTKSEFRSELHKDELTLSMNGKDSMPCNIPGQCNTMKQI
jgi:hypothetical protein